MISTGGNVKSLATGKIIKQYVNERGYKIVRLFFEDGSKKWFKVHRLVAEAFIPNDDPERKTEVNHILAKKWDNRKSQLEWISRRDNLLHAKENGYTRGKNKKKKSL